jgi:glutamate-1-semialdehyde aminotransferase
VRHPFLGAVIGQRHDRAAVGQQLLGALGDRGQRIAADQHGPGKIVGGGFQIAAVELVLVGKRDAMDDEVDRSPQLSSFREH